MAALPLIRDVILAYFISHGSLGNSPYSFEAVPECGTNPKEPACELRPVCDNEHDFRCRAPRWSDARGAWVRVERKETGIERMRPVAAELERTALYLTSCRQPDGSVDESCDLVDWPRGRGQARTLAFSAATVVLWESGLREDIQGGYPPAGRGPDREGCLMQIMPDQAPQNAMWLPESERRTGTRDENEAVIRSMLGFDARAIGRCVAVGMRMLARARSMCAGKGVAWDYGMFASYGTGSRCTSYGLAVGDFALARQKTFRLMRQFDPATPAPKG